MKRRLSILLAAALLGVGGAGVSAIDAPAVGVSHCSAGYTNANLPWGHRCLRAGQFCKLSGDRHYHRYRFHCHASSRDSRGNYHLTR